jgi:hypothetical protein
VSGATQVKRLKGEIEALTQRLRLSEGTREEAEKKELMARQDTLRLQVHKVIMLAW